MNHIKSGKRIGFTHSNVGLHGHPRHPIRGCLNEEELSTMFDSSVINKIRMEPGISTQAFHGDEAFFVTHPWVRHYEQGVPAHITIPDHPLTWLIDLTASLYPSHTAFISYGTKITYAQFSHYA